MVEYRYTTVPGKIPPLLNRISGVGRPDRVTNAWIASLGFQSSNDRTLIPILRQIEFIDEKGVPTRLWDDYRAKGGVVLAEGIRRGYAELFQMYPDANNRTPAEITSFVKANMPKLGEGAVGKVINTFRSLVSLADFGEVTPGRSRSAIDDDVIEVPFKPANQPLLSTEPSLAAVTHLLPANVSGQQRRESGVATLHIHLPSLDGENAVEAYQAIMRGLKEVVWNDINLDSDV